MQTPVGPALQCLVFAVDGFSELSAIALKAAWDRWIGPQRFERKLAQFARRGWLEERPATSNSGRILRLTAAGRLAALDRRDPPIQWRRAWDGRWRMVLFDLPESHRASRLRLRKQLRRFGFGYLQRSAWISPDSTEAVKTVIGTAAVDVETLLLLEARPASGATDAELVAGAWDFGWINRAYEEHGAILRSAPTLLGGSKAWRNWFKVEWRAWRRAVARDPLLPAVLHPVSYRGREAWERRTATLGRLLGAH